MRNFEDRPAARESCPLLLGIVGPSGSGKTYSALRIATGIVSVRGGDVYMIDTEARRALHYADKFAFRHMDFQPPFGPLDYKAAIAHALDRNAGCIVIDSMTHEHSGEGGVLDQIEDYLTKKAGDNFAERQKFAIIAHKKPKAERKALNNFIVQIGSRCPIIFCYRAHEKLDFKKKQPNGQPVELGYQPETTSPLMYEMTQQFLLHPGCDGVPVLSATLPGERAIVKSPMQFRNWFAEGQQLDEAMGARFAEWARGGRSGGNPDADPDAWIERINAAPALEVLQEVWKAAAKERSKFSTADWKRIETAKNDAKRAIEEGSLV